MNSVDVGPVVELYNVNHDLRLVIIRWNDSHECAEPRLVRKVLGSSRVTNLGDGEQLKQILNLEGDGA